MSRKDRPRKTLARKLRDLEDHLHFLSESLQKLVAGDAAYLKSIATELRVLVCRSSGTEGLLWRLLDELHLSDAVHVHLAGNLDRSHPLARGLQFIFAPVLPAGKGDPRLSPDHYSLKAIIKDCEALVVSGTGYTHESLIRAVAEQMGSAHEDDGVAPHLIELSDIMVSSRPALTAVLSSDAALVLEVGEAVLFTANGHHDFVRTATLPKLAQPASRDLSARTQQQDFESPPYPVPVEGTVMFLVSHAHHDWRENANGYDFGVCAQGALKVQAVKHPDGTMQISIAGIGGAVLETRKPIPKTEQPGVMVGCTWSDSEVIFYLCGERVDSLAYRAEA